jgi:hypothetical protein
MSRTPLLLDVPRDSPTRKQRLSAVKSALMIETNYCRGLPESPWLAVHMPSARALGKGCGIKSTDRLFECCSKIGRLLDESGIAQYGTTEREAIRKVCEHLGLPINVQ